MSSSHLAKVTQQGRGSPGARTEVDLRAEPHVLYIRVGPTLNWMGGWPAGSQLPFPLPYLALLCVRAHGSASQHLLTPSGKDGARQPKIQIWQGIIHF